MSLESLRLQRAITEVLFDETAIAAAVGKLAAELLRAFPPATEIVLVGVLEGARPFTEDLARALRSSPLRDHHTVCVDYIKASSYGGGLRSSGVVTIESEPSESLTARNVVLVDDVIDAGHTLETLSEFIRRANPTSLLRCVLLQKPADQPRRVEPEYVGLAAPSRFIVGYGLDYQENFRSLPYLAVLNESLLEEENEPGSAESGSSRE